MKLKRVLLAAIGLLAAHSCAIAGSTIDPTQPPTNGKLLSQPVRNNFVGAFNDINNLLTDFASPNPPSNPSVGQRWRNTGLTPNEVFQWSGTAWLQISTFDITGGTITPFMGNTLLAWQELVPGLGVNGDCLVFAGASSVPTARSCLNGTNFVATPPIDVSVAGAVATISLGIDSNFAVSGGNLALAPIAAGSLIANCGASGAEPVGCSWNSFANQAIGATNGMFPVRSSGAWQTKLLGVSVNDPGTGTIEDLLPVQTNTVAAGPCTTSCVFASGDLFKKTRRSNGGAAMSDTFPPTSATGMTNGARIVVANVDATATETITAGTGTVMSQGTSTDTVGPGRDVAYEYDLANTQWRRAYNTGTALLGPNNLSDLGNIPAARGTLIPANSLTLSQFPNIGVNTVLGSIAGGTPVALSQAQLTSLINPATFANTAAPSSPAAGNITFWTDSTDLRFHDQNASGIIGTTVVGYSAVVHQFLTGMNTNGTFAGAQPAFTDISGVATGAQLPVPGASSLGAVFSKSCAAGGQFVQTINTDGTVNCVTPAGAGNVSNSGTPTAGQFAIWTASTQVQGVSPAAKTDEQAGSSVTAAVTPSQQQQHDSALKAHGAWTISGGAVTALSNNYNITLTRSGVGLFTASFTTPFAAASYDCMADVSWVTGSFSTSASMVAITPSSRSTGSIGFTAFNPTTATDYDPSELHVQCAGRQ